MAKRKTIDVEQAPGCCSTLIIRENIIGSNIHLVAPIQHISASEYKLHIYCILVHIFVYHIFYFLQCLRKQLLQSYDHKMILQTNKKRFTKQYAREQGLYSQKLTQDSQYNSTNNHNEELQRIRVHYSRQPSCKMDKLNAASHENRRICHL